MKKERLKEIIDRLLLDIEEEDVAISLFSKLYQQQNDLRFFEGEEQNLVVKILKKVSEDSERHKEMLEKIITHLGGKFLAE